MHRLMYNDITQPNSIPVQYVTHLTQSEVNFDAVFIQIKIMTEYISMIIIAQWRQNRGVWHTKYIMVDKGKRTSISSVNFSHTSFMKNREAGV